MACRMQKQIRQAGRQQAQPAHVLLFSLANCIVRGRVEKEKEEEEVETSVYVA